MTMIQAPTKTAAPAAPAPAHPTSPGIIAPGRAGAPAIPIPTTAPQVLAIRARVDELRTQLRAINNERLSLASQLRVARVGPDATGIEAHIGQLDARILGIESDMGDLNRALAAAPDGLAQTSTSIGVAPPARYGPFSSSQLTGIFVVGTIFVLAPLAISACLIAIRRANRPPPPPIPREVGDRLENMERGIEAVAIEIERIGEGQRFVTQLLSDRAQRAALPEGVPRT